MTFRYFAYGSNMWEPQLRSRCPSAVFIERARLSGWRALYDKPSTDGSSKLNIRPDPSAVVEGLVYEIADAERSALDRSEPLYDPIETEAGLTYFYPGEPFDASPYDWYVAMVERAAGEHGLTTLDTDVDADPLAPGVRPAAEPERLTMERVLSEGLRSEGQRHYMHPGDLRWWMYHSDERRPLSFWLQGDDAFAIIDATGGEFNVFARPGASVWPLIRWSRRRLGDSADIVWVADDDSELVSELSDEGFELDFTYIRYQWDLIHKEIPMPVLPASWTIRPVAGEHEAEARRAASHAAFESTMDSGSHLERYLRFMRSPVYEPDRDLVVVDDAGNVGSFMIWWSDPSGVAQIEPFGTHPDFQRLGLGRALIYKALIDMRESGTTLARVCTDVPRKSAISFYEGVGFDKTGHLT